MAGAAAVSVGTMNMIDPALSLALIQKLEEYCGVEKIDDMKEITGIAHRYSARPVENERGIYD
jgi:dihydroorotate dehydrogenase